MKIFFLTLVDISTVNERVHSARRGSFGSLDDQSCNFITCNASLPQTMRESFFPREVLAASVTTAKQRSVTFRRRCRATLGAEISFDLSRVHISNNIEATMSKQHCPMLQVVRFIRQSRTLLRHCCYFWQQRRTNFS